MTKDFSMFVAGLFAGVVVTLAVSPKVRGEARSAIDSVTSGARNAVDGVKHEAMNHAATQKNAIANSVEAARATYKATVKSAGLMTAPMEG